MNVSPLQRLVYALLLAAYTIMGTSLVPLTVLVVSMFSQEHEVLVSVSENQTEVRLHHRTGMATPLPEDHANSMTRLVVSISHLSLEGDHQILTPRMSGMVNAKLDLAKNTTNLDGALAEMMHSFMCPFLEVERTLSSPPHLTEVSSLDPGPCLEELRTVRLRI